MGLVLVKTLRLAGRLRLEDIVLLQQMSIISEMDIRWIMRQLPLTSIIPRLIGIERRLLMFPIAIYQLGMTAGLGTAQLLQKDVIQLVMVL